MPGVIATLPKFQFSNALGLPMAGGTLTSYLAGTTTLATTYQDEALTAANTNPIALDSRGECTLWLDSTKTYKFVLKNALGVVQWTVDNITNSSAFSNSLTTALSASLAASSGASLVGYMPAGVGAVGTTVHQQLRNVQNWTINVKDAPFYAKGDWDGTNGTDDYAALQAACNAGGKLLIPAGRYKLSQRLLIDISKTSLIAVGQVEFSLVNSTDYIIQVYSSATYPGGSSLNVTNRIEGIVFTGNYFASSKGALIGHVTYDQNQEILFRNCTFSRFQALVTFTHNAWRTRFDHCSFFQAVGGGQYLYFPSGITNAGEVMQFDHCAFFDPYAASTYTELYLDKGQWLFSGCSFGGGGWLRINAVTDANVTLAGCNLEQQSTAASTRMVLVQGVSKLHMVGGIVIQNQAAATVAPFQCDGTASISLDGVDLAGLGGQNCQWESTDTQRNLVVGTSTRVSIRDPQITTNFAASGFLFGMASALNRLFNGDASGAGVNGWAVLAGTLVNAVGGGRSGNALQANSACNAIQLTNVEGLQGKICSLSFWAKTTAGTANCFPAMNFLATTDGNFMAIPTFANVVTVASNTVQVTSGTTYSRYQIQSVVPVGAKYVSTQLFGSSGVTLNYIDLQLTVV